MKVFFKILIPFFLVFKCSILFSQNFGLGLDAIYNFQTESVGIGLRGEFPKNQISIVPQIAYYPSFNKVTEFYAGASAHINFISYGNYTLYLIAHGAFNGWLNYENSNISNAHFANWCAEGGIGIKNNRCLSPFMEFRYNVKWKEANLRLGLVYFFNCKDKVNKSRRKKKAVSCPAYNH